MQRLLLFAALAAVCAPAASAQWFEDFDSYPAASQVTGQGGWEPWSPGSGALVSNAFARTPGNSVEVQGATDLVHRYQDYTTGTWVYRAWQYIPSGMTGTTYFILLNTYVPPGGPYAWSVQVAFNGATGNIEADLGSSTPVIAPYLADQWVELEVVVDLDQDWCKVFYGGTELDDPTLPDHPTLGGGYTWTGGVFGGGSGARDIAAVDLFANGASACYYDDISLTRQYSWYEDFDAYAANSQVVGQGGWEEWSVGSGAFVANAQARSPSNSIDIGGATDLVHRYSGVTSGKWVYRAWQYIPSGMSGKTYFILLNTYPPSLNYEWSVQVGFDGATGNLEADLGSSTPVVAPYLTDRWVEIKAVVDLDQDWCKIFYDGTELDDPAVPNHPTLGGGYPWTGGVFGGGSGARAIAAVDLFANLSSSCYYDDVSLTPFEYETFGRGCPGSLPPSQLTCLHPARLGQTLLLEINRLPQSMALLATGFDNQNSPLGPLPFDLATYGMPGCMLRTSGDSTEMLVGTGGTASHALPIPNLPALLGTMFHEQALVVDPGAGNAAGAVVSDAATGLVVR